MKKLGEILSKRKLNYRDFQILVYEKTGYYLPFDRISKYVNGKQEDIYLSTAKKIADSLDVKIDELL